MHSAILLFLIVVLMVHCCEGKKMWGSRKKKDEVDDQDILIQNTPIFEPKRRGGSVSRGSPAGIGRGTAASSGFGAANGLEELLNVYLKMMDELLDSKDFETLVNPESIKSLLDQFPGAAANPELSTLLRSPEFSNPVLLKSTMREGIEMIRASAPDIVAMLSDPAKIAELIEQLPPEMRQMLRGLQSGDMSGLKGLVQNLPGLDEAQKSMLVGLMEGNTDALTNQLKQVLGDGDQVEAARQQFLSNPEMAEAMGIPLEVLSDPALWAATMEQGMEALAGAGADADDEDDVSAAAADSEPIGGGKRQFGKFSRAA